MSVEPQFYHRMEIPGLGLVGDAWDLRPTARLYVGEVDFEGKRVLDVGASTGFLSFSAEAHGASEVVAFDLADGRDWDLYPFRGGGFDLEAERRKRQERTAGVLSGFWLARERLGSEVKTLRGMVYDLQEELEKAGLGPTIVERDSVAHVLTWDLGFDVVLLCSILLHLNNPMLAVSEAAALVRPGGRLVIVEPTWKTPPDARAPLCEFIATRAAPHTWWRLSADLILRWMLGFGFEPLRRIEADHLCIAGGRRRPISLTTYLFERPAG